MSIQEKTDKKRERERRRCIMSKQRKGDRIEDFMQMSERERKEYLIAGNTRNIGWCMFNILLCVVAIVVWALLGMPWWSVVFCLNLLFAVWNYNRILRNGKFIRLPRRVQWAATLQWFAEGQRKWPPRPGKNGD